MFLTAKNPTVPLAQQNVPVSVISTVVAFSKADEKEIKSYLTSKTADQRKSTVAEQKKRRFNDIV